MTKEEYEIKVRAINAIDFSDAYMIGDHGSNFFGKFSHVIYDALGHTLDNHPELDGKLKEQIIKAVQNKAVELREAISTPNQSCVPPLINVLAGAVTCKGSFSNSLYLDNYLPNYTKEKYGIEIAGFCTGIPMSFWKEGRKRRVEILKQFRGKNKYAIDTSSWGKHKDYDETARFNKVVKNNLDKLAEAIIIKQKEDKYRFMEDRKFMIIRKDRSKSIFFIERDLKKPVLFKETDGVHEVKSEEIEKTHKTPPFTAICAYENTVAAVASVPKGRLYISKAPDLSIKDIIKGTKIKLDEKTPIELDDSGQVTKLAMNKNNIYLTRLDSLEKKELSDLKKTGIKKDIPERIWSLYALDNSVYCGSMGKVFEFDENLVPGKTYNTGDKSPIIKVKTLDFNGKRYIFGIDQQQNIYKWIAGSGSAVEKIPTKGCCFDVQAEDVSIDGVALCLYYIDNRLSEKDKKFNISIKATELMNCEEDDLVLSKFVSEIERPCCNETEVLDIQLDGSDMHVITNPDVYSIENKKICKKIYELTDLIQVCFSKYNF